jgi:hypothetical protein
MTKRRLLSTLILLFTIALLYTTGAGCFSSSRAVIPVMTLTLPDGSHYEGQILNGQPHGNGTQTFPDGRRYSGVFSQGRIYGYGVMYYPDGRQESGKWQNGKLVGK